MRLRGRDNLTILKGRLVGAFHGATLSSLQNAFLGATGVEKTAAVSALNHFRSAALELQRSENSFRARAVTEPVRPSLLTRLRSADEMRALRDFHLAKENLLQVHPGLGKRIALLMEPKKGDSPRFPQPKRAAPSVT